MRCSRMLIYYYYYWCHCYYFKAIATTDTRLLDCLCVSIHACTWTYVRDLALSLPSRDNEQDLIDVVVRACVPLTLTLTAGRRIP